MDEFHLYDDRTRRFRHTDASQDVGLRAVAQVLRLPRPPPEDGLLYELSFYSGGIGVVDELAVSLPVDAVQVEELVTTLNARTPEALWADAILGEDIRWLLSGQEAEACVPPAAHAESFINAQRRHFQPPCTPTSSVWLGESSNTNDWAVLWVSEGRVNDLGYSQG